MRRAPFVGGATVLGLVGVLTFHSQSPTSTNALATPPKSASPASATGAGAAPSTSTTSPPSATPSTTSPPASVPPSSGAAPTTTPTTAPVARTAVGKNEQYGYGELTVKVTVNGKKITAVAIQNLQTAEQYSQQLAAQVIPMLRSQVLSAQSARINGVSGATYTSEAYALSLQSALNSLHVP